MTQFEYTVRYTANTNISFHNDHHHSWDPWEGDEETIQEVENALYGTDDTRPLNLPLGMEEALELSGFEWWVEVREVQA